MADGPCGGIWRVARAVLTGVAEVKVVAVGKEGEKQVSLGRAIIFAVLRQSGKLALRFWKLKLTAAGKAKVGPEIAGLSYSLLKAMDFALVHVGHLHRDIREGRQALSIIRMELYQYLKQLHAACRQ